MELILLLFIFTLSVFLGFELISKVPSQLHTPLMSGSNAISGITIVGAIVATGGTDNSMTATALGFAALVLATHALCMPLLIRMGITKGQWIYLLALAVEFGAVALVGKLGDMNVASMFVAAKMFDRRAEG